MVFFAKGRFRHQQTGGPCAFDAAENWQWSSAPPWGLLGDEFVKRS